MSPTINVFLCFSYVDPIPLTTRLSELRSSDQYTDVTLVSGDVRLPCHRVVLQAASPYFMAFFLADPAESTPSTLQMTIDPAMLRVIVDYVYGCEVEITASNAQSLVEACDILQLKGLKTQCQNVLLVQVGPSNCVSYYWFAKRYKLETLQKRTRQVLLKHFEAVCSTPEFKEMSCSELAKFIREDVISLQDEHLVLAAVQRWVDHDPQPRANLKQYRAIMELIRRPSCSACRYDDKRLRLVVVGRGENEDNVSCEYLRTNSGFWKEFSKLPTSIGYRYSVCQIASGLMITSDNGECWLFDTTANTWTKTANLITPRYRHNSIALNHSVYVLGGRTLQGALLASVERFDTKLQHWTVAPDMPKALYHVIATVYDSDIYIMGGHGAWNVVSRDVHRYDTKSCVWRRRAKMPSPCHGGAVVTLHGQMYVVGGYEGSCLRYDPATDHWSVLQKPLLLYRRAPAVEWKGRILLAGGVCRDDTITSVIEEYDPATGEWSTWDGLLRNRMIGHSLFKWEVRHIPYGT